MSQEAVVQSARALEAYSLGVLAFMLIKVLAPGFFARQDLKTPVRVAVICMVANMVMNLILIWPRKHVGLALATSLSSMLNAGMLFCGLYKIGVFQIAPGWGLFLLRLFGGCAAMVAAIWWLNVPSDEWFDWGWQQRALQLGLLVVAGMVAFVSGVGRRGLGARRLRHRAAARQGRPPPPKREGGY